MTIKTGDRLPAGVLWEFIEEETPGCSIGPNSVEVEKVLPGRKIAIFGLPGAFTPTCSAKHVPGYVKHLDALKAKKVDEVWCISVNDGYVMAAWGKELGAIGKVRMLGDGSAELTKKLGLERDHEGMGLRMKRFSMLVDDGVVKQLNIEAPSKFEVSNVETMLAQLG